MLGLYLARARLAAGGARCRDATALPRAAEEFLSWLEVERGRSPRTLWRPTGATWPPTRRRCRAGRDHGTRPTSADVAGYLAALRRTHSAASVARALSSIRGFHRFLVEEGAARRRSDRRPARRSR